MYILYLDDSGSANNPAESHLVLGGISVFERQAHWLSQKLDALAANILPTSPNALEFHASEIFSGRKHPWKDIARVERIKVIKDVLAVLQNARTGVTAFACVVHKPSYPNQDPMAIAFEQLCSRFDIQLKRCFNNGDPQRGIIVLDESSHETTMQGMAHDFRTLGTRWGVIRNLTEVPLFVDSRASRLVQLADAVAYSVFRRYEAQDTSYIDIILNRFDSDGVTLHGLVHKHATGECLCPACLSRRV